ncbi:MAG: flagellar basal-body rod protein FlgF [Alphaproteobacteria bacterium]|jgi:flagellar basal-body rod protein FlgF|nr:flagellar basal-body rod protein FlgF [Alphaproteobacteria bacterium]
MENAIYIALSRQMALRRQMDVTANNIANMNTAGFKGQQMLFREYLMEPEGTGRPREAAMSMVIDQGTVRDMRAGPLAETGNPLDVALEGPGYLVVDTVSGPRYTRNGHLSLDIDRQLVDGTGLPVLGTDGQPLVVPQDAAEIMISEGGEITAIAEAGGGAPVEPVPVGTLRLVTFEDERRLTPLGGGLYATNQMPQDSETTRVMQGMIEQSNVQPILEMTQMIAVSRQYQSTQSLLQDEHDRLRSAIQKLGRMPQS